MVDDNGAVLLDLEAGKYFSLNGTAAQIWEKIEEGLELSKIISWMENEFGASVSKERLEQDLEALVKGLAKKGLVHAVA